MKALEFHTLIDSARRLELELPPDTPCGQARVLVLLPEETDAEERSWSALIAQEWAAELSDPREDVYTLADGEPVDASG
jgi:hypothetical protein